MVRHFLSFEALGGCGFLSSSLLFGCPAPSGAVESGRDGRGRPVRQRRRLTCTGVPSPVRLFRAESALSVSLSSYAATGCSRDTRRSGARLGGVPPMTSSAHSCPRRVVIYHMMSMTRPSLCSQTPTPPNVVKPELSA